MNKLDDPALLHVYSPAAWHDDNVIVGNRDGLTRLKEAIEQALSGDRKHGVKEASTSDGEGFDMIVILNDDSWHDDSWKELKLPYTDPLSVTLEANKISHYEYAKNHQKEKLIKE